MNVVRMIRISVCVVLLCAFGVMSVLAQDRSVYWERWDVTIDDVDTTSNEFRVTEAYNIMFTGTFTFGSVVIPLDYIESIENIEVRENAQALSQSCSGARGTFCAAEQNNELSITYYLFNPVSDARRSFSIAYTVIGALRIYEGGDQLWWDAIPAEHFGFSIGSASVNVQLPSDARPREGIDPVETYGVPTTVSVNGSTITASAVRALGGDDSLQIRVQYPHNPQARIPAWQASYDQQAAYIENVRPVVDVGLIGVALAIAIGLPLWIFTRYQQHGRDPQVGAVPTYLDAPPSDMPPAMVGTLVDERADLRDVISTLLDMARRGYLVIEESRTEGMFGIGQVSTFVFKRTDKAIQDAGLKTYEQRFLNSLFPGNTLERSLESLKMVFYTVISAMQTDLYKLLTDEGYFRTNPNTTRITWRAFGSMGLALSVFGAILAAAVIDTISAAVLCIPLALGLSSLCVLLAAPGMPARTSNGAEEAAKWRAFVEYLRHLDRYGDVGAAAQHFEQYLPYAVAAGIDRNWLARFRQSDTFVPVPPWYFPTYLGPYSGGYRSGSPFPGRGGMAGNLGLPGELARADDGGFGLDDISGGIGNGLESISNGLTNMLESAGRIMTSQPQSSGGSSGRWSSGGRGFSGGGSFGGGGRASGGGSRGFG